MQKQGGLAQDLSRGRVPRAGQPAIEAGTPGAGGDQGRQVGRDGRLAAQYMGGRLVPSSAENIGFGGAVARSLGAGLADRVGAEGDGCGGGSAADEGAFRRALAADQHGDHHTKAWDRSRELEAHQ